MQPIDPILNPTVFVGAFEWREPVTCLTDFLVAIVAMYAFYRLQTYRGKKAENFNFYKYYFLCFAIGMTSAAWFGHGLQAYVGPRMKIIGWLMSASGLFCMAMASLKEIEEHLNPVVTRTIRSWLMLQYAIIVMMMISPAHSNFVITQLNSTVMLIFLILPMQAYHYRVDGSLGSLRIVGAILYGIIPGLVYTNQISVHRWFNYHDISHVLMSGFMGLMFWGVWTLVKEMDDQTQTKTPSVLEEVV